MMTEKERGASPLAPAYGYPRSDAEAGMDDEELRRQKRKKLIKYIIAFVIFQTIVIVIMSLTVMKIRTPKYRLRSAEFGNFNVSGSSFNIMMDARLRVKNMNFGTYKFDESTIKFYYGGEEVGNAIVPKSKVGWLSSKKFTVSVSLSNPTGQANSSLENDFSSGYLPLTVTSTLNGKVRLTFMFKKKKGSQMNCSFKININTREIENMKC